MESGVEVWLRLATTGAWVPAAVQSKKSQADGKIRIEVLEIGKPKLANGDDDCVSFVVDDELTDMNDLKLKNSETEGYVENLIKLPYLHEPAILHCLEQRYFKSDIYTYTGPILIAVNPFKKVDIYTSKTLEVYYNHGLMKSQNMESSTVLPPHVLQLLMLLTEK
jgi:myosin heavy subunit